MLTVNFYFFAIRCNSTISALLEVRTVAVEYRVDQPKDEYCLSSTDRSGHEKRHGMYQRQHCRGKQANCAYIRFWPSPPSLQKGKQKGRGYVHGQPLRNDNSTLPQYKTCSPTSMEAIDGGAMTSAALK